MDDQYGSIKTTQLLQSESFKKSTTKIKPVFGFKSKSD